MKKENFKKLLETLGFYEEVTGKMLKIFDAPNIDDGLLETTTLSWYEEADEYYLDYDQIKRGQFLRLAHDNSEPEQNMAYRAMLSSINIKEEIEHDALVKKVMPYIKQAILQAVGTIPTQIEGFTDLSPEVKEEAKDMAKEAIKTCLYDFDIKGKDIEMYWGLNA